VTEARKEESLFMRLARAEKRLAEIDGVEPEGWIWTEDMDRPRRIDFDAIEDEEEDTPNE
jgi:hypothetical protein